MAKIEQIMFPGNLGTANELVVTVLGFDAEAQQCMLGYMVLSGRRPQPSDEVKVNPKVFMKDQILMSNEEFEAWGDDNQYLIDLVAEKLGLALIK